MASVIEDLQRQIQIFQNRGRLLSTSFFKTPAQPKLPSFISGVGDVSRDQISELTNVFAKREGVVRQSLLQPGNRQTSFQRSVNRVGTRGTGKREVF